MMQKTSRAWHLGISRGGMQCQDYGFSALHCQRATDLEPLVPPPIHDNHVYEWEGITGLVEAHRPEAANVPLPHRSVEAIQSHAQGLCQRAPTRHRPSTCESQWRLSKTDHYAKRGIGPYPLGRADSSGYTAPARSATFAQEAKKMTVRAQSILEPKWIRTYLRTTYMWDP